MWDMIVAMATERLWIYTALVGSLFGLAFLVERWGLTWLQQPDDAWRKKYPYVTKKIDEIERNSIKQIVELEKRIIKLEEK